MKVYCMVLLLVTNSGYANENVRISTDISYLPGYYNRYGHSHSSVLDPDGVFTVLWTPNLKEEEVVWELQVRTLGWVGFGFSPNGGMRGSDIMTAWIKDGQLYIQDRHGVGDCLPPEDVQGDWFPLSARENGTHTTIIVKRKLNTCDRQDFIVTNDTLQMIYAWGSRDPLGSDPQYHGTNRGNRYTLALLPFHHQDMTPDIETWTVSQRMTLPTGRDTFYWCHVEKIPTFSRKHHYVGFDMVHGKNSANHLHHSVAFECVANDRRDMSAIFEKYVGKPGYECYTRNMPVDFYRCERFLINWAVGNEGELLPERVGYPLGDEHGGATYVLFQTHYDNKPLHRNLEVEWAMKIYHTAKLRDIEAGNMALGHSILFSLTIPPGVPQWQVSGHCSADCTLLALPRNGITVFTVFLHGHYLARTIRLRHFRNGLELPPIAYDNYFDADFQQSRRLQQNVKILPGDHLTVECDYDSTNKTTPTFSGWGSLDEMCQAFIYYYPRVSMSLCRSSPDLSTLSDAFNISLFQRDLKMHDFILNPRTIPGPTYQEYINSISWNSVNMKELNRKISHGRHLSKCQYNFGVPLQVRTNVTRYPRYVPFTVPKDETCTNAGVDKYHYYPELEQCSRHPFSENYLEQFLRHSSASTATLTTLILGASVTFFFFI